MKTKEEILAMDMQQTFEYVVTSLIRQGKKCYHEHAGTCCYLSGNLRCGIGFLIPDDEYEKYGSNKIEGTGVISLIEWGGISTLKTHHDITQPFLSSLQGLHDTWNDSSVSNLVRDAWRMAEIYGLNDSFLTNWERYIYSAVNGD